MSLSQLLTRRVADTGGRDADTLHGILLAEEVKAAPDINVAHWLGCSYAELVSIRQRARSGLCVRVPPVTFDQPKEKLERLPGLFSRHWKRSLIAGMLKPDDIMTDGVQAVIDEAGYNTESASAVSELRADMKTMGVDLESSLVKGTGLFRYRIVGNAAWRMQKIIANGWAL